MFSFASRHRRLPSEDMDKENMSVHEDAYITVSDNFVLSESAQILGMKLSENNVIVKLDNSSPIARKFRVGDKFTHLNGKDVSAMSVAALLEGEHQVSLTALRPRGSGGLKSYTEHAWAGN